MIVMCGLFSHDHRDVAYANAPLRQVRSGSCSSIRRPEELVLAVRAAAQGHVFITPSLAGQMLQAQNECCGGVGILVGSFDIAATRDSPFA